MKYYLSIDAGTSVIKSNKIVILVLILILNKLYLIKLIKTPVITDSFGKSELNMKNFWDLTSKCIYDYN